MSGLPYSFYENHMLVATFMARGDADAYLDTRCAVAVAGTDLSLKFGGKEIAGFGPDGKERKS